MSQIQAPKVTCACFEVLNNFELWRIHTPCICSHSLKLLEDQKILVVSQLNRIKDRLNVVGQPTLTNDPSFIPEMWDLQAKQYRCLVQLLFLDCKIEAIPDKGAHLKRKPDVMNDNYDPVIGSVEYEDARRAQKRMRMSQ